MPKASAGLLIYRRTGPGIEFLIVHPGGPFWRNKDEGAWSIPKGELDDPSDDPLAVAVREFEEEIGEAPPDVTDAVSLGEIRQSSGKRVTAWAIEGDLEVDEIHSNTFEAEWPPRSGRMQAFPEVDRAGWFEPAAARAKLLRGQAAFVDRLLERLAAR